MNELESIIAESIPSPIENEPEPEEKLSEIPEPEKELELPEIPNDEIESKFFNV